MSDQWYCRIADQEIGPLSSGQLRALAGQGRLTQDDPVRPATAQHWIAAGRIKGLFKLPSPPPPPETGAASADLTPGQPPAVAPQPPARFSAESPPRGAAPSDAGSEMVLPSPEPPPLPAAPEEMLFDESDPWNAPSLAAAPPADFDFIEQSYEMTPATAAGAGVLSTDPVRFKRQQKQLMVLVAGLFGALGLLVVLLAIVQWARQPSRRSAEDGEASQTTDSSSERAANAAKASRLAAASRLDAARQVWKLGDVSVKIATARIEPVQTVQFGTGGKGVTAEEFLVLRLEITNNSPTRKIEYTGWSHLKLKLVDNFLNDYFVQPLSTGYSVEGQQRKASLYPEKTLTDILVFQRPAGRAKHLVLTLPAAAFGEQGSGTFEISALWIRPSTSKPAGVKKPAGAKKDAGAKQAMPQSHTPAATDASEKPTAGADSVLSPPPGSIKPIASDEEIDVKPLTHDPKKDLGIPAGNGEGGPPARDKGDPAKPSGDPAKPSGDPAKPSGDPAKPSGDSAKPSGDPAKPSGDPAKPSGDPAKPSGDPAKPSGDPAKPSGDSGAGDPFKK